MQFSHGFKNVSLSFSLIQVGTNGLRYLDKHRLSMKCKKAKKMNDWVKFFPPSSHILPCSAGLWTSRRKVSVRMCSVEENGGAGLEGGPARECFIISNVASPQALSKVSELREPGARNVQPPCDHLEQSSSPLSYFRPQTRASAWIMCLNTVALFIWLNFSPCKFKGAGLPGSLKLTWYAQNRGNTSEINTFVAKALNLTWLFAPSCWKMTEII